MSVREIDRFVQQWNKDGRVLHRQLILAPTPRERERHTIGPWSARCILLRALGRCHGLPENEPGLTRAAPLVYKAGVTLTPRDVKRISNEYGRWRGYWAGALPAGVGATGKRHEFREWAA